MRRFTTILLLLIIFSSASFSQDSLSMSKATFSGWMPMQFSIADFHSAFGSEAGVSFDGLVSSNSVNLPFSFALLGNDYIDNEKKQHVTDRLKNKNVVEDGYDIRTFGSWQRDSFLFKKQALLTLDFSVGNFSSGHFTDQFFNTVFYGNAYYAGQTADFSGTKEYNYEYERIGFSMQENFQSPKSFWQAGAKISVLNIHTATRLNLYHGTLFTEENGEYLDAGYNFEFTSSDSSNHGWPQSDGPGVSLDLMTSWTNSSRHTRLSFYVNNLGAAFWNKNSLTYSADSTVHFEGIEVTNFLSHDEGPLFQFNTDSIIKYTGTKTSMETRTFALPVRFSFVYEQSLTHKMVLQSGISYRPYPDLYPLIFVKPKWIINPAFEVAAIVSAGGAYNYALGFEMRTIIRHHLDVQLGSNNVLGIFIPEQTTSASLFLQLSYQF